VLATTTDIVKQNRTFVDCEIQFDLKLWYEDLPAMTATNHSVTPKPDNYPEIIDAIGRYSKFIDQITNG
jgi:hypothetical protein